MIGRRLCSIRRHPWRSVLTVVLLLFVLLNVLAFFHAETARGPGRVRSSCRAQTHGGFRERRARVVSAPRCGALATIDCRVSASLTSEVTNYAANRGRVIEILCGRKHRPARIYVCFWVFGSRIILKPQKRMTNVLATADKAEPSWRNKNSLMMSYRSSPSAITPSAAPTASTTPSLLHSIGRTFPRWAEGFCRLPDAPALRTNGNGYPPSTGCNGPRSASPSACPGSAMKWTA